MATAQDVLGMIGVRNELINRGISNDRIGWNQTTGTVTIDGQDFLKPTTIYQDRAYEDPTKFNNAFNVFDTAQRQRTAETNFMDAINTPAVNPYDQQITDMLTQLTQRINNPTPYNVYASPEYAAYQAQADRDAQRGIRSAQESLGASRLGRSSVLSDRAQGIQNEAQEYLQTQVVPQLIAAQQAREQQTLGNLMSLLNALGVQQSVFDARGRDRTDTLGRLLDYSTGRADTAYERQYRQIQDDLANRRYDEETAYRRARDLIADEQWKMAFDEDVRQFGVNEALRRQEMRQSAANAAASNRLARERFDWERDPNNPDNILRNLQIEQARNPADQYSGMSANQVLNAIQRQYTEDIYNYPENSYFQPQKVGERITTDPVKREQMFLQVIDAGLPDAETDQVLALLGLTKDEINKFTKKYAK